MKAFIIIALVIIVASCNNSTGDKTGSANNDSSNGLSISSDTGKIALNNKSADSIAKESDNEKRKFDLNYCTTHLINLQTELQLRNNKLLQLQSPQYIKSQSERQRKTQALSLKIQDTKNRIAIWTETIDKIKSGKKYDMDANIKLMDDSTVLQEKKDSLVK